MLVMKDVLKEKLVIGSHENVISYAILGSKAMQLVNGRYKVTTPWNCFDMNRKHTVWFCYCLDMAVKCQKIYNSSATLFI